MTMPVRLCFFIQNHLQPAPVLRLVACLRRALPESGIVLVHDPFAGLCTTQDLADLLPDVTVLEADEPARRGYFASIKPWLRCASWLSEQQVEYDWLISLSAQDYPVRPLGELRQLLAGSTFDGYMRHWDASSQVTPWGRKRQGLRRYYLQYADVPDALAFVLPLLRRFNNLQPWVHTHLTYGPRVGLRLPAPFSTAQRCWAGSAWTILHRRCVEYVYQQVHAGGPLLRWFERTITPDEALLQTLLVNSGRFAFSQDDLRYIDFAGSLDGRPRTLTMADLATVTSGAYFLARKFDSERDAAVLDAIDLKLRETAPG